MRFLIVNADDLGLCAGVNDGILDSVRAGVVGSASLLVGPDFSLDPRPFLDLGVSLGLHFNLTFGRPCAPSEAIPDLVTSDGGFRLAADLPAGFEAVPLDQAAREFEAQLAAFIALVGEPPTHLDSHHHLHVRHPGLLGLLLREAGRLGTPLRSTDVATRAACRAAGVPTTDRFLGGVGAEPFWTESRLREELSALPSGSTELMCHPGRDLPDLPGLRYLRQREGEWALFRRPEVRHLLTSCECITFRHFLHRPCPP